MVEALDKNGVIDGGLHMPNPDITSTEGTLSNPAKQTEDTVWCSEIW